MAIHKNDETSYEGCVLGTWENNKFRDSDWYAACWDDEESKVVKVLFDTTRFAGGGNAIVDATDDALEKSEKWLRDLAEKMVRKNAERKANEVKKGRTVRVVKGNKVDHGTEGKLFWSRDHRHYTRIGIALSEERGADGKYKDVAWTYLRNVEVANPEKHMPSEAELEHRIDKVVNEKSWMSAFEYRHLIGR